jgi:hypothetical protein
MPRSHPSRDRRGSRRASRRDDAVENAQRALEADRRRREICARKDRFESESEARSFAIMHSPGRGPRQAPYLCEVCGGWHLTSRPR